MLAFRWKLCGIPGGYGRTAVLDIGGASTYKHSIHIEYIVFLLLTMDSRYRKLERQSVSQFGVCVCVCFTSPPLPAHYQFEFD